MNSAILVKKEEASHPVPWIGNWTISSTIAFNKIWQSEKKLLWSYLETNSKRVARFNVVACTKARWALHPLTRYIWFRSSTSKLLREKACKKTESFRFRFRKCWGRESNEMTENFVQTGMLRGPPINYFFSSMTECSVTVTKTECGGAWLGVSMERRGRACEL